MLLRALCLLVLAANLALVLAAFPVSGWDFATYCGAAQAFSLGRDPYRVPDIAELTGLKLAYVYPPLLLPVFRWICVGNGRPVYYALYGALLGGVLLWWRRVHPASALYLTTVLATGLAAPLFVFMTGNVDVVLMLGVALAFAPREATRRAGVLLVGAFAGIKFLTLAVLAPLALRERSGPAALRMLGLGLLGMVVIQAASFVCFPDLTRSYYTHVLWGAADQSPPARDEGGQGNPSSLMLFLGATRILLGLPPVVSWLLYLAFCVAVVYAFVRKARGLTGLDESVAALGVLTVLLLLPRLKPYTLAAGLVPLFVLTERWRVGEKVLVVLVACAFPTVAFIAIIFLAPPIGLLRVLSYSQWLAVLGVFLYALARPAAAEAVRGA